MASALLEELTTVATEVKKGQKQDTVGSLWAALATEEDPQGRGRGSTGRSGCRRKRVAGGGDGRGRTGGGDGRGGRGGGC